MGMLNVRKMKQGKGELQLLPERRHVMREWRDTGEAKDRA
jgi:hypothetical protein